MTYWEGSRYNKDMSTAEIAKIIIKEIKKKFPKAKVSVCYKRFAGNTTIDVIIKDPGFNPINPKWDPQDFSNNLITNLRYSERGLNLLKQINSLCKKFRMIDFGIIPDYFNANFFVNVEYDHDSEKKWMKKLGIK